MALARTAVRWGSLAAVVAGAVVSSTVSAVLQACGGRTKSGDESVADTGMPVDGGQDGAADVVPEASTADAWDAAQQDQQVDVVPQNDVSLDVIPAE